MTGNKMKRNQKEKHGKEEVRHTEESDIPFC